MLKNYYFNCDCDRCSEDDDSYIHCLRCRNPIIKENISVYDYKCSQCNYENEEILSYLQVIKSKESNNEKKSKFVEYIINDIIERYLAPIVSD